MFYRKHARVDAPIGGVSRTRQEFKQECDINTIMKQHDRVGVVTHVNRSSPQYMDFSEVPDFQSAMQMMAVATERFMHLPATVRKRFGNDAAEFVKFAEQESNLPQLEEWGLVAPAEPDEAPMRVEVVNSAAAD